MTVYQFKGLQNFLVDKNFVKNPFRHTRFFVCRKSFLALNSFEIAYGYRLDLYKTFQLPSRYWITLEL